MKRKKILLGLVIAFVAVAFLAACLISQSDFLALADFLSSAFGLKTSAFPELTNFTDNRLVLFAELVCMPVYAACVLVLFLTMALTGWSYIEASVYVCEYFQPLFCSAVALSLIFVMVKKLSGISTKGKLLILAPIAAEGWFVFAGVNTFIERKTIYEGMNIREIFNYVVDYLIKLGETSGTNYVLANMYVYILPLILILAAAFAANFICKKYITNH